MGLISFLCRPGLLGDKESFKENYDAGNNKNATKLEKILGQRASEKLNKKIQPYYLSPLKEEELVDELPQKTELVVWLMLVEHQLQLYKGILKNHIVRSANSLLDVQLLRKICDHPLLATNEELERHNVVAVEHDTIENQDDLSCKLTFIKLLLTSLGASLGAYTLFRIDVQKKAKIKAR